MSVEIIAESLLRKSKPANRYLKAWVSEVCRDPKYSTLKCEGANWGTHQKDKARVARDTAIYALARELVAYRVDELNDRHLSRAVLEFQEAQMAVARYQVKRERFISYLRKRRLARRSP